MKDYRQKQGFKDHFIDEPFLEALDEWVWEMDLNGIHTYSNAAVEKILGYTVDEVVGFSTTKLWNNINEKESISKLKKTLATGEGWKDFPAYFIHKEGTVRILLSSAIPVYNIAGILVGYRGIDRDITERIINENALKAQKEHVKLINQVLRHDLTNNISVIKSSLRLYKLSGEEKYLDALENNLNNSVKLIHSMSDLEAFVMENKDYKVFSAREVLKEVTKNRSDIAIEIKGDSTILADDLVFSVFDNLINNAVKHGKATKILMNIDNERAYSYVTLRDNGTGIPDEIKKRLFEIGFTYGVSGNTGVGLHIVKQAMENYRGSVEVLDNEPQGAVFRLRFKRLG